MSPLRILLVDDLPSWRHFVCTVLQEYPEFQVIGEALDGLDAVRKSEELQPDLILLDIDLPKLSGIEAAQRIGKVAPRSTILFVSENSCHTVLQEALHTGASTRGYVLKSDAVDELLPALKAIAQGERFVSRRSGAFKFAIGADA